MKLKDLRAILFDLDGVLVLSEHLYDESKKEALRNFGFDPAYVDLDPYKGQVDLAFFQSLKLQHPELAVSAETLALESARVFRQELSRKMRPVPGGQEFVKFLFERGLVLANVTSATAESQKTAMEILQLASCFKVLVNADRVTRFKPHPEPYLLALRELEIPSSECLVIEDTVSGVQAAVAAGLKTVAIGETFPPEVLLQAGALFHVRNYDELKRKL